MSLKAAFVVVFLLGMVFEEICWFVVFSLWRHLCG